MRRWRTEREGRHDRPEPSHRRGAGEDHEGPEQRHGAQETRGGEGQVQPSSHIQDSYHTHVMGPEGDSG